MRSINFCIPFIAPGTRYAGFLVSNLYATAAHPERITVSMSAHDQTDVAAIRNSSFSSKVHAIAMAEPYPGNMLFFPSANHSRAINALAAQSDAEITIFSDYDMAFLCHGWDTRLEQILETQDICGVAYPPLWTSYELPQLPWLVNIPLAKYQQTPNLSFLAITKKCLNGTFNGKLTTFDSFLANGGLPFQIVNTPQMADTLKLPVGTVIWMDTGFELPFVIREKNLHASALRFVEFKEQKIFATAADYSGDLDPQMVELPEVYRDEGTANPFLAHFRKGTFKAKGNADFGFERFMQSIEMWLSNAPLSQPGVVTK